MTAQCDLQVDQLTCTRGQKTLSRSINFHLSSGELLFIEGPNGSGKTSLLRHLVGLSSINDGQILWQGQSIRENYPEYWQALHYLGHTNGIKLGLTVNENLQLAAVTAGVAMTATLDKDSLFSLLKLDSHQHSLAAALSAGQKRRLALARLWLSKKPLWILDEPLTALDSHLQEIFLQHLKQHLAMGGLCILSSHQTLPVTPNHTLRLPIC